MNNALSHAILKADRLEELLAELGCELSGSGHFFRGPCPVHLGDGDNFLLRTDGHTLPIYWMCFSHRCEEKYKKSLLGLVRGALAAQDGKDISMKQAVDFMRRFAKSEGQGAQRVRPETPPPENTCSLTRAQVRSRLIIPAPYFVERGFAPAVLDGLDVGHSPKLKKSVVPLYDVTGETCIGGIARSEKPHCRRCDKHHAPGEDCRYGQPKWLLPPGFQKGSYVYNYSAALRSESEFVFLVEGAGEVFRLMEAGYAATAIFGTELTMRQVQLLSALQKKVVVVFDNDGPGSDGSRRALGRLQQHGVPSTVWPPPPGYKDIAEMAAGELSSWVRSKLKLQGRAA